MAIRIQIRRGNAETWRSANPVLAQGEEGLELDSGKRKTGNGETAWNELPYDAAGGEVAVGAVSTGTLEAGQDAAVAVSQLTTGVLDFDFRLPRGE